MNMKTAFRLMALCIVSLTMASCSNEQQPATEAGTISGTISGLPEGTEIVLRSFKQGNLINVAQDSLGADGSFSLVPEQPLVLGYHQLLAGRKHPLVLITDASEGVSIQATARVGENYMVGATIQGSRQSQLASSFYNVTMPLRQRMKETEQKARATTSASEVETLKALSQAQSDSLTAFSVAFAEEHANELVALSALESLNASENKDLFRTTLDALKEEHASSFYYDKIKKSYEAANRPRKVEMSNPNTRKSPNSKFIQGDVAPDIVMNDPDGTQRSLSSLKGKVVLLDFWASWCGPCRRENPNVVRAYEKYRDQGFEVFSVSLDSDASRWKQAIEQDQLSWPNHVSDLQGWRNAAAREYGISSIPHTMLIDRDGVVLATHLRGNGVESALRGLFGE